MTFKPGDVVTLNSGGPLMTVEFVRDDEVVQCLWFDGKTVCRDGFDAVALVIERLTGFGMPHLQLEATE